MLAGTGHDVLFHKLQNNTNFGVEMITQNHVLKSLNKIFLTRNYHFPKRFTESSKQLGHLYLNCVCFNCFVSSVSRIYVTLLLLIFFYQRVTLLFATTKFFVQPHRYR